MMGNMIIASIIGVQSKWGEKGGFWIYFRARNHERY